MKQRFDTRAAAQWLLENAVILDAETTGLDENARIMEIAIIDGQSGRQLQNNLVECHREPDPEAFALHGITSTMTLACGITVQQLDELLDIVALNENKWITSFNLPFEYRMIIQTIYNNADPIEPFQQYEQGQPLCIMELANRHLHQHLEWDFEQSKFKRLSLARCCEIAGVEFTGQAHRALPDAIAARDLLVAIAEGRA
tara:strand:+ start:32974 stop:33573 length:600 start_codon:yes stop_codon:yes gene_type:complete